MVYEPQRLTPDFVVVVDAGKVVVVECGISGKVRNQLVLTRT